MAESFPFLFLTTLLLSSCATPPRVSLRPRAGFIAITNFSNFTQTPGAAPGETVLTSPAFKPPVDWDELVVSWNTETGAWLRVEARGIYPDHTTRFYTLGLWSVDPASHPRESVAGQKDADGTVKTDTLVLTRPGANVQLRLTLGWFAPVSSNLESTKDLTPSNAPPKLKFLGLSFCGRVTQTFLSVTPSNRAAWGKSLPVPERRQGEYPDGGGWCSPVSLSMVLAYWSQTLHRPELDRPVPDVAAAVYDPVYDGTGNWPFNTAYAGAFPGLRACVTRLNDLSEIEDLIAAGVPPILSVSSYLTNDRHSGPNNGHLVVCIGFTANGDVIVNNPGVSVKRGQSARCIYPRARLIQAWAKSKNTVYLVYPETLPLPPNPFGDWEPN